MKIERNFTIGRHARFDMPGNKKTLHIGENCNFGDYCHIVAYSEVVIGNDVLIASKVFISDTDHGTYTGEKQSNPNEAPNDRDLVSAPVKIGNRVWLGENVVILAGTTLGDGCIVGANSVLKGEYPDNAIIVGAPAVVKKCWNKDKCIWERV